MNSLKAIISITAFAVGAYCSSGVAHAQAWPAKPVKIVVPYAPGGAVDTVTRKIAVKLQEQTGQSFVIENKAGATGTIGMQSVAQSPADGYTLVANDTTHALLPHIFKKLPFDHASDLVPVSAFIFAPFAAVVRTDSSYKTLDDLLKAARAEPGKLSYGTGGAGSSPHFATEALAIAGKAKFLHVPFKGAGEATAALLGGTIDFQIASTPGFMGQFKAGRVRMLAVSGDKRPAALSQVPTFTEAGLTGLNVNNFTGWWAPKGTPVEVIARLQKEIAIAMASADIKAYADSIGAEAGHWDAAAFAKNLAERTEFWGKVAANAAFERQ